MIGLLKRTTRALIPIGMVRAMNAGLRSLTARGHQLQFKLEWGTPGKTPAWFDHFIEQCWKWRATRNPMSWERGIFSLLAMRQGCRVLDLCCGGGFFSYHFYSGRAASVVAVDIDPDGIRHAEKHFHAPNITFVCADVRTCMPEGKFDNVTFDAAFEYFTPEEVAAILANIKRRLTPSGILSGFCIIARETKSHADHKYEFSTREEVRALLKHYFANVVVVGTTYTQPEFTRNNLYFFGSDGPLPFDETWIGVR